MKRFLSSFLALLFIIGMVPRIGLATDGNVKPPEPTPMPNLIITSSNVYRAEAGDSISVSVDLKNTSNYYARNITATLGNDKSGDTYVDGRSYEDIRGISPGSTVSLSFKVTVDPRAEGGVYELPLSVTYYNDDYYSQKSETLKSSISIRVEKNKNSPQLVVNKVDIMPSNTVNAGQLIAVGFDIENIGSAPASDIRVTLEGLKNDGFTLAKGVNYKTIPSLNSGKKTYVYFELKSEKNILGGSYELNLNLSYKDIKDTALTDKSNFFITVAKNEKQSSNLIIENLVYPTNSISQNREVDVSFDIRNQGLVDARNVIITATSEEGGIVAKSVSTIKFNTLAKGASEKISFKFLTTKDAETKNYPIKIKVSSLDDADKEDIVEQFIGIFVVAPDKEDATKGKPRLIIDKYSFEPQLVKAGENFQMTLSFYNTSSNKAVKNIKIFLTAEPGTTTETQGSGSSAFTPVDSSNTFYIDSISPKGKVEKTITMFTIPDAVAKTHTITANFQYEDSEGNPLEDKELIGVPVVQQSKLDTGELQYYADANIGVPTPISLEFYNTGKVTLYNMMVKLEGDFQTENGSYYIGNFTSGSSEYFEGMVIPSQPGELEGAVLFSFEDSTGQLQEVRKEFKLNVMEMPPMDEFPEDFPSPEQPATGIKGILKSKTLWLSIGAIALGIGGFIFYKKKKKAKEMAFDE